MGTNETMKVTDKIRVGMTREEVVSILGEPDAEARTTRKYRRPLIYKYGDMEIHFDRHVVTNFFSQVKVMNAEDAIKMLQQVPPKTPLMGRKFVQRWSGDPNDTDLSGYEDTPVDELIFDGKKVIVHVDEYS